MMNLNALSVEQTQLSFWQVFYLTYYKQKKGSLHSYITHKPIVAIRNHLYKQVSYQQRGFVLPAVRNPF